MPDTLGAPRPAQPETVPTGVGREPRGRNADTCGAWVAVDPDHDLSKSVAVHCELDPWHKGLHSFSTEYMTVTWHV